jgi:hypothetical protein
VALHAQVCTRPFAGHGGVTGLHEPQIGGVIEHQMQVQTCISQVSEGSGSSARESASTHQSA